MPDPLFDSRTPRLELPLLFAGQAQKEGFVNELAARLDALLGLAIEAETGTVPTAPFDGQSWLVSGSPTGAWLGRSGEIASRQAGNWLFTVPRDGMRLLNRATGQELRYRAGWQSPVRPAAPSGGTTIDSEARSAIAAIIAALIAAGVVAAA